MGSSTTQLAVVVGTYAEAIKPPPNQSDVLMYKWSCVVYPTEQPFGDMHELVDSVEFTLHKSFANHVRKVSHAPFHVSAEGWGEFPIIVEIFVRNSGSVKLTHYLKLNAPERYVVSETLDVISVVSQKFDQVRVPDLVTQPDIPVFTEYFTIHDPIRYELAENAFVSANQGVIEKLRRSVEELTKSALVKDAELFTALINQGK